jgi:Tfp pilus assembly protein PilV
MEMIMGVIALVLIFVGLLAAVGVAIRAHNSD